MPLSFLAKIAALTAFFSASVRSFLSLTGVNSGFVTARRSLSWPWVIRTFPLWPAPFVFPYLSVAIAFRCHVFPDFHSRSSFIWALTVIVAGLFGVAVISPVKCSTLPVPYWEPSSLPSPLKKLSVRAGKPPSAFGTILNSDNLLLLSVAVNSIVKSSPA